MKAIINGIIVTENEVLNNKALLFDEKIIGIVPSDEAPSDSEIIDADGMLVLPGLIDLHIHGYAGADVSDGNYDDLCKMSAELVKNGVTAWCPTTMTLPLADIERAFDTIRRAMNSSGSQAKNGAVVLGANCEGPFINPAKKGAQNSRYIKPASLEFLTKNSDVIRLVTIAPEMNDFCNVIEKISNNTNITISLGHTNSDFKTAAAAIESGAAHITHLFNAMTPFTHREPGIIGAALSNDNVSCELIADTIHVSSDIFELVAKIKKNKLVLITDCMRAGGMPDGEYVLGGQNVVVKNGECRLADGVLAGSVLKLNEAIKNFNRHTSLPLYQIVNMATLNPASVIGEQERRGSIAAHKRADLVIATEDFEISKTIIGGEIKYANAF